MLQICLLSRHLKTDKGDDRRAGIREIVKGIRHDRDRPAEHARHIFPGKQDNVQNDPHDAADPSISPANRGIFAV